MTSSHSIVGRREFITAASAAGLAAALPAGAAGQAKSAPQQSPGWHSATLDYLNSLARPDGGYAADELGRSHLSSTYAVVGCYRSLGQKLPNAKKTAEFIRTHHPAQLKKLEQEHRGFDLEQIEALLWLGED